MRRAASLAGALAGVVVCAGCAGIAAGPSRDLLEAQGEIGRLWASPQADLAADELAEAEAALDQAEAARDAALRGSGGRWDAEDDAYVARRMAERARIATLYEAEREALRKARGAVRRLTEDGERRRAFFDDMAQPPARGGGGARPRGGGPARRPRARAPRRGRDPGAAGGAPLPRRAPSASSCPAPRSSATAPTSASTRSRRP